MTGQHVVVGLFVARNVLEDLFGCTRGTREQRLL